MGYNSKYTNQLRGDFLSIENIKNEVNNKLSCDTFKNLLKKYNILSAVIFGSFITDEFKEDSDIDIALIGANKIPLDDILEIELFLENYLNRNIDIVDLNSDSLDLLVKVNIMNSYKVIYSSDNNKCLDEFYNKLDWFYKENENFMHFRKVDLLS